MLGAEASVPIILGRFLWPRKVFLLVRLFWVGWFGLVQFGSGGLLGPAVHTVGKMWHVLGTVRFESGRVTNRV